MNVDVETHEMTDARGKRDLEEQWSHPSDDYHRDVKEAPRVRAM